MRYLIIVGYFILIVLSGFPIWLLFIKFKKKHEQVSINIKQIDKKPHKVLDTLVIKKMDAIKVESAEKAVIKNTYGKPKVIQKYNVEIELGDIGGVRFTDLNTGMVFGDIDVFGREIVCKGISYGLSDKACINEMAVFFTSELGIVYQVLLHSFECRIVDIVFINLDNVGATYCELYGKTIDEAVGREKLKLDIEKEKAEFSEFRVEGKQCIKYLGRNQRTWILNNFQEALLKMFQEVHKISEYRKMMDVSHGGFGGVIRKPRLSANEQLKSSMVNSYALYKGATYSVIIAREGLRLKRLTMIDTHLILNLSE